MGEAPDAGQAFPRTPRECRSGRLHIGRSMSHRPRPAVGPNGASAAWPISVRDQPSTKKMLVYLVKGLIGRLALAGSVRQDGDEPVGGGQAPDHNPTHRCGLRRMGLGMTTGREPAQGKGQAGPRHYSAGTRAALALLSQGTCYFPGCATRTIEFLDGDPFINVHIAHIRDAKPGNRYVADMTDDERRSFANLVLLCKPHHTLVDKMHPERYSIAELEKWKIEREGVAMGSLRGLNDLTEERLEEMIRAAVSSSASARSVELHWSADVQRFEDAVAEVLRSNDDITPRRFLEQCEADWRQLIADRTTNRDVLCQLLDRLTCLAALALRWERQPWTVRCVETLERMYAVVFGEHGITRHDLMEPSYRLMAAIINRVLGLGVVALEHKAWSVIPELVVRRPDLPQFDSGLYTNWIRHTTTEVARAEDQRRPEQVGGTVRMTFIEAAIMDIAPLRCVNVDAPRIERFRSLLTQFDALATVAVWGLAPGDGDHPYYPWHRAYEPNLYEPALVRLLRDGELRNAVFPGDDGTLANVLLHLQQFSQGEFARFGGGWPYMADEIRVFLARCAK